MTVGEVARHVSGTLAPKFGGGEAKAMMYIIFENLKGWNPVDIAIKSNEEMTSFMIGEVDGVLKRLLNDEPIQYIFGNASFYGLKVRVKPGVLIPRPETAELVDIIVKENQQKDLQVADLCTGSGCIALALARNLPFAEVIATDVSDVALSVAKENNKELNTGIELLKADILKGEPSGRTFDIIVSNPPYIAEREKRNMEPNVLDHEPSLALFVPDNDPLIYYRAILDYAGDALAPGGKIYFEINPLFADDLRRLAQSKGFDGVELMRDSFGKVRFARITRKDN